MPTIAKTFVEQGRWKQRPLDFFETPLNFCAATLKLYSAMFPNYIPSRILDPGAGTGNWGRAIRQHWQQDLNKPYLVGVELDKHLTKPHDEQGEQVYNVWCPDVNFVNYSNGGMQFDLVIGNPPYSAPNDRTLARKFVQNSLRHLRVGGSLLFLLKLEFIASSDRRDNLYNIDRPLSIYVCDRISFNGTGRSNTHDYALFHWIKRANSNLIDTHDTKIRWFDWKNLNIVGGLDAPIITKENDIDLHSGNS